VLPSAAPLHRKIIAAICLCFRAALLLALVRLKALSGYTHDRSTQQFFVICEAIPTAIDHRGSEIDAVFGLDDAIYGPGRNAQITRAQFWFVRQFPPWFARNGEAGYQGHFDQNVTHFIVETDEQIVFGAGAKVAPLGIAHNRMETAVAILGADGSEHFVPLQTYLFFFFLLCQPRYPVTSGHIPMHRHVPA
jgi:hypothetical protein